MYSTLNVFADMSGLCMMNGIPGLTGDIQKPIFSIPDGHILCLNETSNLQLK
jgi:hypothetical protein